MLKLLKVLAASWIVNSNVFLLVYVEDTYVLLPKILYNFPCLETFVNPGKYLAKLSSAFPSSHNLPNLSTLLRRSFTFAWLSIDGTAETSFKGLKSWPSWILFETSLKK